MGADLTDVSAVLLLCWVETPGKPTLSVSKGTVTDPVSTQCSARPERIKGKRKKLEGTGGGGESIGEIAS